MDEKLIEDSTPWLDHIYTLSELNIKETEETPLKKIFIVIIVISILLLIVGVIVIRK